MMIIILVILLRVFTICSAAEYENKYGHFIVACHTTDFLCFKRQYYYLRDNLLLGSKEFDIPTHQPYKFQYSDTSTCVNVSGVEESQLVGISFHGIERLFSITLTMPVRLQQVEWKNETEPCAKPDREFYPRGPHLGPMKKYSGNATLVLTFPYTLYKKNDEVYMRIEEDELDAIIDIPDSGTINWDNMVEMELYESSEWAYSVLQHVDIPEHAMVPYIEQVKKIYNRLPLERLILLYPPEDYTDLVFRYRDDDIPQ